MKLDIKERLDQLMGQFLFEENDIQTQKTVKRILTSYLSGLKVRRVIEDYHVDVDTSSSTESILIIHVSVSIPGVIEKICIPVQLG